MSLASGSGYQTFATTPKLERQNSLRLTPRTVRWKALSPEVERDRDGLLIRAVVTPLPFNLSLDPNRLLINALRSVGRVQVASRLVFLDTLDRDEDLEDVRLDRHALSSLSFVLFDRQVADPTLTSVRGEIWAQWETREFRTYILFKADGTVDYGQTRKKCGAPGECGTGASPGDALSAVRSFLHEEG